MLEIHLELRQKDSDPLKYQSRSERVEQLTNESLQTIREKHAINGWEVQNWSISEQLPFDEGRAAAIEGISCDGNPYAEDFWKHHEWHKGWDDYQESND